MKNKTVYSVHVGNLGNVHEGTNKREANRVFVSYVRNSKAGYGRAGGENVELFGDAHLLREYSSPAAAMRADLESGECAVIHVPAFGPDFVTFCGKRLGTIGEGCTFRDESAARRAIRAEMNAQGYFPNLYRVNERGNVDLLSVARGKVLASWV